MSETLKLEVPVNAGLARRSKWKGLQSIVSSFQPLNHEKTVLKKSESTAKDKALDKSVTIANRFVTLKCIGSGGFGEVGHLRATLTNDISENQVYSAKDREQKDLLVAIKIERSDTLRAQLPIEKCVFEIMHQSVYVPRMFYFGTHNEYTVLVMDLLGPSVEDLLSFSGRRFSPKTVCMIGEQILRSIEALHNHSLIHRDLKPDSSFSSSLLQRRSDLSG